MFSWWFSLVICCLLYFWKLQLLKVMKVSDFHHLLTGLQKKKFCYFEPMIGNCNFENEKSNNVEKQVNLS